MPLFWFTTNFPFITITIQAESNLEEQPENEETLAEERPGEEHAAQEETQENSGEEVTKKPPNIDCEEVHNNDGESGEALQPSMTNVGTLNELIEYEIFGEGSQISTNQKRENSAFSPLIG